MVAVILFLPVSAWGQTPKPPPDTPTQPEKKASELPTTGPVPVPEPSERALEFYWTGNVLWVVNTLWGLAVPALFLFTGFSARLRDLARRLGRKWFFVVALYFVFYAILTYLIDWPLNFYEGFVRAHAYDLSNQTFAKWQSDSVKALLVTIVAGVLFLWIPYLVLAKSPRRWWLYTGLLVIPFLFFLMLVTPIWVEPLFNRFHEMTDKDLEAKILALANRAGIEESRVYEVDKSVDTKTVNAYVTGFLATKRIVLWDTLLAKFTPREVLFVMGHEMGHYVLGHIVQGVFVYSGLIILGLYLVHRISHALLRRFHGRFGFDQLEDVASLPLILLVGNLCALVLTPVGLAYSRHCEHEADRFGLEITHDNHAAATAFVKLLTENLANPRPGWLFKWWRASHPTAGERIDFCNEYRPWEKGEPERYGDLFLRSQKSKVNRQKE
jgi:Zn-dependent protease with chaperone function